MLFGLKWRIWALIAGGVIVLAIALPLYIAGQAWDARGRLEAANREAEIAAAEQKAETLRASLNAQALELAETQRRLERAIEAAGEQGRREIADAAQSGDGHALYVAWARARERVWTDAGFAPDPPG